MLATESMNGKHTTHPIEPPKKMVIVRVFRIEPGTTAFLRMLSPEYGGIFTHFHRGRSQYCTGQGCVSPAHKIDRVWKGYVASQVWEAAGKKWFPVCLEITESLELTFRGIYARGQVWELWRHQGPKGKSLPVEGKLCEERDQASTPPPFSLMPCLRSLFHVDHLDMSELNPLPPRVVVEESRDAGPAALQPKSAEPMADHGESWEQRKARLKDEAKHNKSPTDQKPTWKR